MNSIYAGGDQSLVICNYQDGIEPIDYRKIQDKNQILTIKVIEQLNRNELLANALNRQNNAIAKPAKSTSMDSNQL